MNPSIDGEIIRISFPPLTTEDREKYTKLMATKLESGRIMIRQLRGEAMHEIKKSLKPKKFPRMRNLPQEKTLQKVTDEYIGKIEEKVKEKTRVTCHLTSDIIKLC